MNGMHDLLTGVALAGELWRSYERDTWGILPQAARHYGRLPVVTHGLALRVMSLRDGVSHFVR